MSKVYGLLMLLWLAGCASEPAPPPPSTSLQLSLLASTQLNPTTQGNSAPLRVKLYLLKGTATFERADFFALFEQANATLGADLLAEQELLLRPGESLNLAREVPQEASHLAVLAGFRDLDRAVWRQLTALQAQHDNPLIITFDARSIVIAPRSSTP